MIRLEHIVKSFRRIQAVVDVSFTVRPGTITPGSEPNLAEVFRDNAAVWLEIQVGAETPTSSGAV